MNKFDFLPNEIIYEIILNICDKYNYPSLLKNITDDYVINKNMILSQKNYTWYVKILSNFKETEEYVLNLIDSSFSDLKIPISAEFYEMLILRWIIEEKIEVIIESVENLDKRYIIDFPDESIRNKQIYEGNIFLIENFIEIFNSKNYHQKLGLKSEEIDEEFDVKIESSKIELNPLIYKMLKKCIEINPDYINDEKFLKICISFYSEKIETPEELIIFVNDVNNSQKNAQSKMNFNTDVLKKVLNNFKFIGKGEEDENIFVNYLRVFDFLFNSNLGFKKEIKLELFGSVFTKKILEFLKENISISYKDLVERILRGGINSEILTLLKESDFEILRKLIFVSFRSEMKVNKFLNDFIVS